MNMRQLRRSKYKGQFTQPSAAWRQKTTCEIIKDIHNAIAYLTAWARP